MKHKTLLALIIGLLLSLTAVNAATVSHSASEVTPGSFQVGSYNFPGILTVGTALFVNASSGNVGIGTTTPIAKFEVAKTTTAQIDAVPSWYTANFARIGSDTGSWSSRIAIVSGGTTSVGSSDIILGSTGDIDYNSIGSGYSGTSANDPNAYLSFTVATQERMRIKGNGNVGIGTTSPSGALHVKTKGSDITGGLIIEDDGSTEKCGLYIVGTITACTDAGGSVLDTGTSQYTLCARCE